MRDTMDDVSALPPSSSSLPAVEALAFDEAAARSFAPGRIVVVDASDDLALALGAAHPQAELRLFQDTVPAAAPAPEGVIRFPLGAELVRDADLVVGTLPKALAALEELTRLLALHAAADVQVVLAGREKHLNRGMNAVLARGFDQVSASRGRSHARALCASGPRPDTTIAPFPRVTTVDGVAFPIAAHGAAFAGTTLDIGTRALLEALPEALSTGGIGQGTARTAVDLGCGTGVLATRLATMLPEAHVIATDRSWAAAASARATAQGAGVSDRVSVRHEDAGSSIPSASVDLVLLNPPFHDGHTVDEDLARDLFAAAARMLRPGGILLTVYNSHLSHRSALSRIVGPTAQLLRTPKFTVTRSTRR